MTYVMLQVIFRALNQTVKENEDLQLNDAKHILNLINEEWDIGSNDE